MRERKLREKKKTWWSRVIVMLGIAMIFAGLGCAALFFIGPPGGTAGSIPTTAASSSQAQQSGGPTDKTLYLTIPKLGLKDKPVYDSLSEEKLGESAIHLPATGFPWQKGANTYIAGHRLGFFGTDSWLIFLKLNQLEKGDKISLEDSTGKKYTYQVTGSQVVNPGEVQVTKPVAGKSIVSLQTCTFPNFTERLIIQGELIT